MCAVSFKRARPILVCLQCKRSKRKCDKLRPTCTRCKESSSKCVYESEPYTDDTSTVESSGSNDSYNSNEQREDYGNNKRRSRNNMKDFCVPEDVLHEPVNLWNPQDRIVVLNDTSFFDYPFALHSLLQNDHFMRALSGSLHGMALVHLGNGINSFIKNNGGTTRDVFQKSTLLTFMEDAIIRCMEQAKSKRIQPSALGLFYSACSLDDDDSVQILKSLLHEIESTLMQKKDCNILLQDFYRHIYPFYPFMDISLFERDLASLFVQDNSDRWTIDTSGKDIRKKIETLCLFMVILMISLKHTSLDKGSFSMVKITAAEMTRQLLLLSHKVLCSLDVFRYPNETTFCCLLYHYVSEHLDPDNVETTPNYSRVSTLKLLWGLAITLGLHHEPSKYGRFNNVQVQRWRRLLWLGVQSIRYQVSLTEGDCDRANIEHMELFLADINGLRWHDPDFVGEVNANHADLFRNRYQFHILLGRLICTCTPILNQVQLPIIFENIRRAENFMLEAFPLSHLVGMSEQNQQGQKNPLRDQFVDVKHVKGVETIISNIIGRTCILNVWDILSIHFEKKCKANWEMYEEAYHYTTVMAFRTYLELAELIAKYLGDEDIVAKDYRYNVDKQVCFTLCRIWIFQCRMLLRLSFKKNARELRSSLCIYNVDEVQKHEGDLISEMLLWIRNQTAFLINLANKRLHESYFCSVMTIPLFTYILHMVDNGELVSVANEFWQQPGGIVMIPKNICQTVAMKWGLDPEDSVSLVNELTSRQTLESFNGSLLHRLKVESTKNGFGEKCCSIMINLPLEKYFKSNEDDILRQFMEKNFDEFLEIIGDDIKV